MNTPDSGPTDEQLGALLGAADKDAAPPDPAVLARLREQSLAAFHAAASHTTPTSLWKRIMSPTSFRWIAASAAAVLVLGIGFVVARWLGIGNAPDPPPDEKFVAEEKLTDDGRIGKVTDAQGVVGVKPVLHERWSPVQKQLVLKPGDWLRTDSRGANAVALKLLQATGVIVGPHSTVELVKANELRLLAGEIEITTSADAPVELLGPDQQKLTVQGKQLIRIEKEKLVRVEKEPLWLQGFKGTTANESIGSLIASVDGRDVPLTVGYHHVTVDIRDQIARTVIEESFVNRTNAVLEGVFYFPLPQDASISGFGMWIGEQLVEADVVEKQRAREIYETILREKRDPGLLEWAGGNIFKARVFPIPALSEKRIKITYTQVLPLTGNRYRYSYGLQSELLKQHPLRDLNIDVKVNSVVPLKSVTSPTHPARIARTEHSGHVEFTAQEYTPSRDFEAVIEVEGRQSDVVVIPHRRGDDGYFMVQLTPPGAGGDWERPLVPNGDPLRLLLLADTSASMDAGQRAAQNAVLASLLGSLTPKDTIDVAACDVNCDWIFEKPVPATEANIATVQQALAKRTSLGWTDLDKAFVSALTMTAPGTHIIYIGDGIAMTGNADPVAFAKRLHRLYEGKAGTAHAIAVGSSFEPAALKAIATLGGGSVRHVSGERGPQAIALELLNEIATPALRDLKVEFAGVRTARVYPEELPNVAAGTQQILLGRYLPQGKDQSGEIIVTGMLGTKPVRFTSKISLKDAEAGNSFIPRLWARMHLDKLLEQGTSEAVQQDIIALSEEFNIITPYTSLLVLESDADRERFAVKRRFQMRDGEKFFAEGRDNASFELKQKQMRQAGDYRTVLRRSVLSQLVTLGRDPRLFQYRRGTTPLSGGMGGEGFYDSAPIDLDGGDLYLGGLSEIEAWDYSRPEALGLGDVKARLKPKEESEVDLRQEWAGADEFFGTGLENGDPFHEPDQPGDPLALDFGFGGRGLGMGNSRLDDAEFAYEEFSLDTRAGRFARRARGSQLQWLGSLFPNLVPPRSEPKESKSPWPAAALALSRSLSRMETLAKQKGGIVLVRQSDGFDVARNELSSRGKRLELVSPAAWLGRSMPDGGQVMTSWCDAKEFGTFTTAFQLGRVRASNKFDLAAPPLELTDASVSPLHIAYESYTPTVEVVDKQRELLILKHKNSPDYEVRYLIDTNRHIVLSSEDRRKGKVISTTKFDDFVEVAGSWWARRIETFDEKGQRQSLMTQTIAEVSADDFAKRMTQELAGKDKVLFLRQPLPKIADAKAAVAAGKATFDDRAVLTLYFAATQQWARALEHLQECERLAAGKSGLRWLRNAFLLASRRHEELRTRLLAEGAALAATTDADALANDYFLAEYLIGQAHQVLQTNEIMSLSDTLLKVYQRQPAHVQAVKAWRIQRVNLVQQSGQPDKALALSKELATDYPRDFNLQYRYAQRLANSGDYASAYAWLKRILAPEAKWDPSAEVMLRGLFTSFLEREGRFREVADYIDAWMKRTTDSEPPYDQYLSALVRSNQAEKAVALVAQWLREAQAPGERGYSVYTRLNAAINFATGRGYNLYINRIEERWHAPLAEVALFFIRDENHLSIVTTIFQSGLQNTDAGRAALKTLAGILVKEIDTLSTSQLDNFIGWVWSSDAMEPDDWKKVAAGLRKRWDEEKKRELKYSLGQSLLRVLGRISSEEALLFLHVQLKEGPEQYRSSFANQLFSALLSQPWTAEIEDEAFALLDKLAEPEAPAGGLLSRVPALYRLTDAMIEARYQARMNKVEHPEKLPRVELQKKQDEIRKLAREGYADRLRKEASKQAKPFANWLNIERLWIEATLERDLKQVAEVCWEFLATPPAKAKPDDEGSAIEKSLDDVLRDRYLTTITHLAARKGADAALVERLVKYVDQQIKDHPDDAHWRGEKYRLLIALDRPKELEKDLGQWLAAPDPDNRWRLALGYLLAEQGRVAEAIKQFESVEAADELGPREYRSLADWYLIENRREPHEKAVAAVYKTTNEYQLSQRIQIFMRPWQVEGHLPTQLDKEVLQVFKMLFEKSAVPQNYLWQLQQFYGASRNFELLSMLADGVIGHTAGKVYPFLGGMSGVLSEVRDEATADELVARIAKVRQTAKTAIDQRALDLLELLVERRAAELQNQPGPHVDKALAVLVRAFKGEWSPGEPRLMADFLGDLGKISQPALAKEQLRQLEVLHRGAEVGSFDRLHIAVRYARTLFNAYERRDEAMDLLQIALKEYEEASAGILPTSANDALAQLISFTETVRQYDRGEKLLLAQLKHPIHTEQKNWLVLRLNGLYHGALVNGGEVSLGKGAMLYKALERKLFGDLETTDQNFRSSVVSELIRLYRSARDLKLAGVADDLKAFAFKRLPPILKEQTTNYDTIVHEAADALRTVIGPRDGIAFLLDRVEDEPGWLRYTNRDAWNQYSGSLGDWRLEVKQLGDLEPRLLKFVLVELRRDLRSREPSYRNMFDRRRNYYWQEKAADFAKAAEEILAERKQSGASVEYIAEYLFWGLPQEKRAIEILFAAHEQKLLAVSGQWQLVDYLHRESRFAESIPLLLPLVETRPDNIAYSTKLMHAYYRTGKQAELLALLKKTDAYFHGKDRWNENPLAALAESCLENHLYSQSVAYFEELIPLHQRSAPRRGIGNGTLSNYYAHAAQAYSGLGKTKEAVDMASGAVVSWGPNHDQRKYALEALVNVLADAPNLAAYIVGLDKEKLQSAVVRKAIGQAYIKKNEHARAIPQLQIAAELQPNDAEIYTALVACYDKIGDKEGAVRQLLQAVELSRRDIKLYEQLGQRFAVANQPVEAERAYTSIVEMLPNESESHAALAEVREKENRWSEAISHWERVAQIRSLEPTGLLKLAAAQIHERAWDSAANSLHKLRTQNWPQRFTDVQQQTRALEKKLEEQRMK